MPDELGKCADGLHAVHQWTCNNETATTHNATVEVPGSMSNGTMDIKTEENLGLRLELGGWSVMGYLLSTIVALQALFRTRLCLCPVLVTLSGWQESVEGTSKMSSTEKLVAEMSVDNTFFIAAGRVTCHCQDAETCSRIRGTH